ncbi:hypothetical protein BDZ45DRAFT_755452 [Acephala macrosclerotiorum]|nr:hypothetical protein BDZ45DRAFT_755452 [Acephala macrosclerotiorum]
MHLRKALVFLFRVLAPTQAFNLFPAEQVGKYNLYAAGQGCLENNTIARNFAIPGKYVNLHRKDAYYISLSRSGKTKWYWLGRFCHLVFMSRLYQNSIIGSSKIIVHGSDDYARDRVNDNCADRHNAGYTEDDCMDVTVITREMPRDRWHCVSLHETSDNGARNGTIKSIKIFSIPSPSRPHLP